MDLGGGRKMWRQEAGSKMLWKKSRKRCHSTDKVMSDMNGTFLNGFRLSDCALVNA